jgi:hypothetical protein
MTLVVTGDGSVARESSLSAREGDAVLELSDLSELYRVRASQRAPMRIHDRSPLERAVRARWRACCSRTSCRSSWPSSSRLRATTSRPTRPRATRHSPTRTSGWWRRWSAASPSSTASPSAPSPGSRPLSRQWSGPGSPSWGPPGRPAGSTLQSSPCSRSPPRRGSGSRRSAPASTSRRPAALVRPSCALACPGARSVRSARAPSRPRSGTCLPRPGRASSSRRSGEGRRSALADVVPPEARARLSGCRPRSRRVSP